tara:strand:- start:690 stop:911 length:222 start_codon:yes stop_codon:yes gene_type:complete
MKFKFIKSDEPMLTDDMYELIENPRISIQVNDDFGYILNILNNKHTESKECGIFNSLFRAKQSAISLNKHIGG